MLFYLTSAPAGLLVAVPSCRFSGIAFASSDFALSTPLESSLILGAAWQRRRDMDCGCAFDFSLATSLVPRWVALGPGQN